jgi:hypothetical protein
MDKNKDIASDDFLKDIKPGSKGFKVPKKYFEELPFKVNASKEVKKVKAIFWLWTTSAVTVCSLVLALFLFDKGEEQVNYYSETMEVEVYNQEYFDQEISEEDLIDFMISNEEELN